MARASTARYALTRRVCDVPTWPRVFVASSPRGASGARLRAGGYLDACRVSLRRRHGPGLAKLVVGRGALCPRAQAAGVARTRARPLAAGALSQRRASVTRWAFSRLVLPTS